MLDLGGGGIGFRNAVINGNCRVAQYGSKSTPNNVATYGGCDRIFAYPNSFSTASGTVQQSSGNATTSGNAQQCTITTTGTGSMIYGTRLEAKDTARFAGRTVTISAKVYHDVGSAVGTAIQLYKANAADNFSAVTQVGTTVSTGNVANATWTPISATFTVGSSDAANGMMIFWQFQSIGAVTSKTFAIGDLQMTEGSVVLPIDVPPMSYDEMTSMRYYEAGTCGQAVNNGSGSATVAYNHTFRARKRTTPTCGVGLGAMQVQTVDGFTSYQGSIAAGAWYNPTTFTANAELS